MPWWGWIIVGTLLLGAEMLAIDAQFYLIFVGVAAIGVGLVGMVGIDMPLWGQWLLFAAASLGFMVLFRRKLYDALRGGIPDMPGEMTGNRITIPDELATGAECRVMHRGTHWTARNIGAETIAAGAPADIVDVSGLTLNVRAHIAE